MKFEEVSLADAVEFIVDNRGKSVPVVEKGFPLIATNCISNSRLYPEFKSLRYVSQDIYDNWFRSHPLPNDVIITNKGSQNGAVCLVPNPVTFCIAQDMVALRAKQGVVYPLYLLAALRSEQVQFRIRNLNVDAVIPHLKKTDFNKLFFPLPDNETQRAIGDFYFEICSKIELNIEINQTLEQLAQALFKSWFVDFEPVKAKIAALEAGGNEEDALLAAMQAISGKGEAELTRLQAEQPEQYAELRATAKLFPSAMQESELGEIPEGWSVSQIGDLVTRIPVGKKYSQKTASETGEVPVLDQGKSGIIGYHNEKPGVTACPDDPVIVFANHTCYMRLIMHDFSAIQNVLPFKSKPTKALNIFWLYFATLGKQEFVEYKGHWPDFVIKEIVVPDNSIASRFGSIAKDLVVNQFRNDKQNETLSAIRDAMLPKLLSGELSVTDFVNQTENAEASINV